LLDYDASPDGSKEDGPERFSVHYEADLTRGGRSVLDIRPLLWSLDGWPIAGDNLADATYQIVSRQSENTLEEHIPAPVPFRNVDAGADPAPTPTAASQNPAPPPARVLPRTAVQPQKLHLGRYLALDYQKWTIASAGGGFYKIVNTATADAIGTPPGTDPAAIEMAPYTGADGQLWSLDQFPDGSYRIRNKATGMALTATGTNGVAASNFVHDSLHLWTITTP
jgi:arabinan endo-1,5-alpha-L-arabinosidase